MTHSVPTARSSVRRPKRNVLKCACRTPCATRGAWSSPQAPLQPDRSSACNDECGPAPDDLARSRSHALRQAADFLPAPANRWADTLTDPERMEGVRVGEGGCSTWKTWGGAVH